MNYYHIDDKCFFVDLPGFGFAKAPQKERVRWGKDIQKYLMERSTIELVFHLVDCRHKPTKLDEDFFYWLGVNEKPFAVLLTKSDKLTKNKLSSSVSQVKHILKDMNIDVPVIPCSAETGGGIEAVQNLIKEFLD